MWLKIDDVKSHNIIFEVPEVDAEVVSGNKVFPVGTGAQGIDIVVVTVFELLSLHPFEALTDHRRARKLDLTIHNQCLLNFLTLFVLYAPEFDDAVIGCEQLHTVALVVVKEVQRVNLFI